MGQYHRIYNLDKKETLGAIASGVKLQEQASDSYTMTALMVLMCNSNGRGGGDLCRADDVESSAAIAAIQGRWAGDRIVVQGDYAQEGDPGYIAEEAREAFEDITDLCVMALKDGGTGIESDRQFLISESFKGRAERKLKVTYKTKRGLIKERLFADPSVRRKPRRRSAASLLRASYGFTRKDALQILRETYEVVKEEYVFVAKE